MNEKKVEDLTRQEAEELTPEQAEAAQGGLLMIDEPGAATDPRARGGEMVDAVIQGQRLD